MRVSREQAAENRQRIVETASRMFREHGFDGVGVDAIMNGAGLTHGGFYGHFRSKDDLAAEAMTRALERSVEKQRRYTKLNDLVSDYLSGQHCANRARGCALAAQPETSHASEKALRSIDDVCAWATRPFHVPTQDVPRQAGAGAQSRRSPE